MHVSLDSALGRQRRLNSVGESVLQIAPNAAAAYSLRSLTGGDPTVVRVRRDTDGDAGDNDEQDFTASEVSSGALVDFVGSGNDGFVETWYDQSGNSKDATQATAGSQPKIVDEGVLVTDSSGNPALVGDGTDDTLFNSTLTTELDNSDLLVTAAYKDDLDMGIDGGVPRFYLRSANFSYNANNIINYTPQTGRKILSFQVVGDTQEVFGNGTSLGTASEPQSNIDGNMFNVMRAGGAFSSGPLMEVLVYNSNQSATRTAIESNINGHYSIF